MIELVLASWRLAHLLVEEEGPYAIFSRFRRFAGMRVAVMKQREDAPPQTVRVPSTTWAQGLTCVWCVTVWTATLFVVLQRVPGVKILQRILSISAGAVAVQEGVECLSRLESHRSSV